MPLPLLVILLVVLAVVVVFAIFLVVGWWQKLKVSRSIILGRLPEVAPVAVSVPWGFEKFDGVARGIL